MVGAFEAKTHLSELRERVQAGEDLTIAKHAGTIANLVPVVRHASPAARCAAIERLKKLATHLSVGE